MPVAKFNTTPDAMKSDEGNGSLDTIIKHATRNEHFLSFSRANDNPVHWIQLLHALDQPEHWPLLSPVKVQMQKCDKCSREFVSSINYRRHMRVHHRLKSLDKDSSKNRDLLGAFWDKLTLDAAKEIVSFNNVHLEEVQGSSILKALATLIQKPGFTSLPQVYLKSGSALMEIIQAIPYRLPISSQELFRILDDASERTFLCGTAVSMQKYIFDGEVGKISLEARNLVACTGFLVEQKLVQAWLADKDAEALRCQKLLVEEEEAAQKRQAETLERKRQKKLRQKEQKAKDQRYGEKTDPDDSNDYTAEAQTPVETTNAFADFGSPSRGPDHLPDHIPSSFEPFHVSNSDEDGDTGAQLGNRDEHTDRDTVPSVIQTEQRNGRQGIVVTQREAPLKSKFGIFNGVLGNLNSQETLLQKRGNHSHLSAKATVTSKKIWSQKLKSGNGERSKSMILAKDGINHPDLSKNHEVLIGSIAVTLGCNSSQQEGNGLTGALHNTPVEHQMSKKKNNNHEKPIKNTLVKLWRPVSRQDTGGPMPATNGNRETEVDDVVGKTDDQTQSNINIILCANDNPDLSPSFSKDAAKAFLVQRWKETMASNHVKLVVPDNSVTPECLDNCYAVAAPSSDIHERNILGNADNRLVTSKVLESSAAGSNKPKFKTKPDKGGKMKYIPKQRIVI